VFIECGRNYIEGSVPRRVTRDVAGRFRSITLGDDKLIYTPGHPEPWERYDLASDPWETTNIWDPVAPGVGSLTAALRAWMSEDTATGALEGVGQADVEALRALGYVE